MLDFQQKRKIRSVLYHKATLIILSILVLIIIHSTWGVYQKKKASENLKNTALEKVTELRVHDDELTYKIERLETDQGIEEEIRAKFNVAKAYESMVIVVENDESNASTTIPEKDFWQTIKDFLF